MKLRVASLGGLCVLSLMVSWACDVEEIEPRGVELEEIEAVLSQELCARVSSCRCEQGQRYPDPESCEADARMLAEWIEALPSEFPTAELTYDPTCLGATVDAYVALGCDAELPESESSEDEDQCTPPCHYYYGTRLVGQSCEIRGTYVTDCAKGLRCSSNLECFDPCAEEPAPTGVKEGGDCYVGDCVEGLFCDLATETCQSLPVAGEPCHQEERCADELLCDFDTGLCRALPLAGEPCFGSRCAEELFCEMDFADPNGESLCYAPQPLAAPCRGHAQCDSGYCPAGACDVPPAEGEACSADVCGDGLDCVDAVCVLADSALCWVEVPSA